MLRCIIAGVAEMKSSFPFGVCSYPRVFHLASSLHRRAWCPPNVLSTVWLSRVSQYSTCVLTLCHECRDSAHWKACESLPASFPTRSTSAFGGVVVVVPEVVSVAAAPGGETAVVVLCTGGAPSAAVSAVLTRVHSATDCVVSLDVICCRRCGVGIIWQIEMYFWNRAYQDEFTVTANFRWSSSRDGCRFPRIPKSWRSREWCPNVVFPLCVSMHGFEPCHSVFRSSAHLFCCHVRAQHLRAMLIPIC